MTRSASVFLWCLTAVVSLTIVSCGSPSSHRMHTPRREIVHKQPERTFDAQKFYLKHGVNAISLYKPCETYAGSNDQFVAHSAMLVALIQAGWTVELHLPEEHRIRAYSCLRNNPENCVVMVFISQTNGKVVAGEDPAKPIRDNLKDDLQRWLVALQQKYALTRCYVEDTLKEEMAKFGYQLEEQPGENAGATPDGGTGSAGAEKAGDKDIRRTKYFLGALRTAGLMFRVDNPGKCPTFEDLAEAGLLYSREKLAADLWGNPYVIECAGEEDVVVTSLGPDGEAGTPDDVAEDLDRD